MSIASPGFIDDDARAAKDLWFGHWHSIMATVAEVRGWAPPTRQYFDHDANGGGALFVGAVRIGAGRLRQLAGAALLAAAEGPDIMAQSELLRDSVDKIVRVL